MDDCWLRDAKHYIRRYVITTEIDPANCSNNTVQKVRPTAGISFC